MLVLPQFLVDAGWNRLRLDVGEMRPA